MQRLFNYHFILVILAMQYSEPIMTLTPFWDTLKGENTDKPMLIKQELAKHQDSIAALLSSYHWDEKGIVQALTIDPDSINIDKNGNGRFKVNYAINIHYGCSDIDIDLDKSMTIKITTDMETRQSLLTGE